ncbi:hypothetical protein COCSADRAFT_203020 [Bipolaris sorokiniana ND90Pr]|uniref:Carboxylic ester hydrolase n=1 Tax=Cochliobolus sativus (strain ND90Pr / ATCC 201652) TaxID=665912 RepID=M2QY12_COCSN|nr:uncharacterized protein COCSADRAFT_203020 [Bipolaris sorokiniana ND90Pr]EMD59954.1 hypothetical protein COCSADRAFT_203020 [Bipolaris sorokiniana ND90Pr]
MSPSRNKTVTLCLLAAFGFSNSACAAPNPKLLGSDLTILTHNDLYGTSSTRKTATIVLSARQSNDKAQTTCKQLHETLWEPEIRTDFGFLKYLEHANAAEESDLYWIGGRGQSGCRAITTNGTIHDHDCKAILPVLCSQSAALSFPRNDDISKNWQVAVNAGKASILGSRDKLSFRFRGIKYAAQPRRFTYSKYEEPKGNISALEYGSGCINTYCGSTLDCSEDCLFLNVWTPTLPAKRSTKKKAVMLWIHGGGFTSGFGSDTTFDGGNMASRGDVVVVTTNYRLSTLGFLAMEDTPLKGNYWLSDLVAALDWVRANIENFGGDKDQITVFGQSAGAAAVRALIASPLAKGKFARAILQSCPGGDFAEYQSIKAVTNVTNAILNETGCTRKDKDSEIRCLREQDPHVLIGIRNGTSTGTPASFSKSRNASEALLQQGYNASAIIGSGLFPIPENSSNNTLEIFNLTSRVATDAQFRCPTQSTAFSASKSKAFKVYAYEMERSYQLTRYSPNSGVCDAPKTESFPYGDTSLPYYRCHSGELYLIFGNYQREGRQIRDVDDVPFTQYIMDTWLAFGRTGNPNPAVDFLEARGFSNTSLTIGGIRPWQVVQSGNLKLRILDLEPSDKGFKDLRQCEVLGQPLSYYSS